MIDSYVSKKRKSSAISFSQQIKKMFGQRKEKKMVVEQYNGEEYINVTDESFKNPEIEEQKGFLESFFGKFLDLFSSKKKDELREEEIEDIYAPGEDSDEETEADDEEFKEVEDEKKQGFFERMIKNLPFFSRKKEAYDEEPEITEKIEDINEMDEDVVRVLNIVNSLFKKLPPGVKHEFKNSGDYEFYSNVLKKYRVMKKD